MPVHRMCKDCGRSIIVWNTAQTRCPKCQQARSKAKPPKAIPKVGKEYKKWKQTKEQWIKENPPNEQGFWVCYLQISPQCPKLLDRPELTLDHVIGRGRDPSKRHDKNNLKPACGACNYLKGSQSIEAVRRKYGERK